MNLNNDQVNKLAQFVADTREQELNCNEFLDRLAEYAETELASKPIPEQLECIAFHLKMCPECKEEHEALLSVLKCLRSGRTELS